MIGDASAKGKVHSTTKPGPEFKKKNSKGRSYKTIDTHKDMPDDAGDADTHGVAHRSTKGMRPGVGHKLPGKHKPAAFMERNMMGRSYKTVPKRGSSDSGADDAACKINAWAHGKRSSYR